MLSVRTHSRVGMNLGNKCYFLTVLHGPLPGRNHEVVPSQRPTRHSDLQRCPIVGQERLVSVSATGNDVSYMNTSQRWRPLEAALGALGSESDAVLDRIQEDSESGLAPSIDIAFLLANVVPSLLNLSGVYRVATAIALIGLTNGTKNASFCKEEDLCSSADLPNCCPRN